MYVYTLIVGQNDNPLITERDYKIEDSLECLLPHTLPVILV